MGKVDLGGIIVRVFIGIRGISAGTGNGADIWNCVCGRVENEKDFCYCGRQKDCKRNKKINKRKER